MDIRLRLQLAEAVGATNRWYCSEAHRQEIGDPEILLTHYIRNGGALDFARRYAHAMGTLNRWFCSEYYGREIFDPEILWNYYMRNARLGGGHHGPRHKPDDTWPN